MKKFLLSVCIIFLCASFANAETTEEDFAQLYKFANIPDFELVHELDPYQNEDYQKYAWSPYPLFRLSSDMYFKNQKIPAGYYILTPRTVNDRDYIFFKESGKVKFVIPVVKKDLVPPGFYATYVPKPQATKWQGFCKSVSNKFYSVFKKSARKTPPPDSYIESNYIDGNLFVVILYFDTQKYFMVFKSTRF
jgi:hypothetical protein